MREKTFRKHQELIGQKFGELIVLDIIKSSENDPTYKCVCECSCGKEIITPLQSLVSGHTKTCGCKIIFYPYKIGQIIGDLTIIDYKKDIHKATKSRVYICKCICGNIIEYNSAQFKLRKYHHCGCKTYKYKYPGISPTHIATSDLYRSYIASARVRNIKWDIEISEFIKLIHQNCFYCGCPPTNQWKSRSKSKKAKHENLIYTGIDRLDSDGIYTLENVVPCCKRCNYGKRELSMEDFLSHIKKIAIHQNLI